MANKVITMSLTQGNTKITMTETFSAEAPWPALAYQFQQFLAAQGYHFGGEGVNADVESYIYNTEKLEPNV